MQYTEIIICFFSIVMIDTLKCEIYHLECKYFIYISSFIINIVNNHLGVVQ